VVEADEHFALFHGGGEQLRVIGISDGLDSHRPALRLLARLEVGIYTFEHRAHTAATYERLNPVATGQHLTHFELVQPGLRPALPGGQLAGEALAALLAEAGTGPQLSATVGAGILRPCR
jgi:hypothetical protein